MTLGFHGARLEELSNELISWELYRVEIDKYHVMFWFENGHCLANVAYRFSFESFDRSVSYVYDVQATGSKKYLNVDSILRRQVNAVNATNSDQLVLTFDNGDKLTIHNSPTMRSAWFYRYTPQDHDGPLLWSVEDDEYEGEL